MYRIIFHIFGWILSLVPKDIIPQAFFNFYQIFKHFKVKSQCEKYPFNVFIPHREFDRSKNTLYGHIPFAILKRTTTCWKQFLRSVTHWGQEFLGLPQVSMATVHPSGSYCAASYCNASDCIIIAVHHSTSQCKVHFIALSQVHWVWFCTRLDGCTRSLTISMNGNVVNCIKDHCRCKLYIVRRVSLLKCNNVHCTEDQFISNTRCNLLNCGVLQCYKALQHCNSTLQ